MKIFKCKKFKLLALNQIGIEEQAGPKSLNFYFFAASLSHALFFTPCKRKINKIAYVHKSLGRERIQWKKKRKFLFFNGLLGK